MTFLQEYKTFFFLEVLLHIKKKKNENEGQDSRQL